MNNPETLATLDTQDTGQINIWETEGTIKNVQPDTLATLDTQDTGQINVRETEGAIKNVQSRYTGNIEYTIHRTNKH